MAEKEMAHVGEPRVNTTVPATASETEAIRASVSPYSPLPWFEKRAAVPVDGAYDFAIVDTASNVIAEVFGRTSQTNYPNAEQNARYIVTACNAYPELLAALKAVENVTRFHGATVEIPRNEWAEVMALVEAAIAKAEGR